MYHSVYQIDIDDSEGNHKRLSRWIRASASNNADSDEAYSSSSYSGYNMIAACTAADSNQVVKKRREI